MPRAPERVLALTPTLDSPLHFPYTLIKEPLGRQAGVGQVPISGGNPSSLVLTMSKLCLNRV